jgi:hypothetical protein
MKSAGQVAWDAQGSTPQDWHSVGLQNLRRITKGIWQNGHRQYMRKPQCGQNRMESATAQSTRSSERLQSALEQIAKFAIRVPPAGGAARTQQACYLNMSPAGSCLVAMLLGQGVFITEPLGHRTRSLPHSPHRTTTGGPQVLIFERIPSRRPTIKNNSGWNFLMST